MNERFKQLRKALGMSQQAMADKLKISQNYVWMMEKGDRIISQNMIEDIVRIFKVNEVWLRLGVGEMFAARSRAEQLDEFVDSVLHDRPDSFRSALVDTLLHFQPNEWELLEKIFDSIQEKREKKTDEE